MEMLNHEEVVVKKEREKEDFENAEPSRLT